MIATSARFADDGWIHGDRACGVDRALVVAIALLFASCASRRSR